MVSICIITKNECKKLEKCLKHLIRTGYEIVVTDTGSSDETVEMAGKYTDSIYKFEWVNDFSKAKNYCISMAKNDMVLVVDSDEYFVSGDLSNLNSMICEHRNDVGNIYRKECFNTESGEIGESIVVTERLFDRRYYHFAGRVHEQVVRGSVFDEKRDDSRNALMATDEPIKIYETGLVFEHDGYKGSVEERKKKAVRNLQLLLEELDSWPEDPYLMYQIAKSIYLTDGPSEAIKWYERVIGKKLNPHLGWVIDMICCYGYALLETEQYETALGLEGVKEEFGNSADFSFLLGLIYMNNSLFDDAESEFIRCTTLEKDRAAGTNTYKAYYNAGVIKEALGNESDAINYYKAAGNYDPALDRLKELMC